MQEVEIYLIIMYYFHTYIVPYNQYNHCTNIFFILGITKSAGGRFSFHPFNHIRITPGTSSNNNTPTKSDLSTAGSENNVIEGIKTVESNGVTALGAINTASISKPRKLVHSKSTGNLFSGKMKRIKEALRLIITIVFSFTQISLIFNFI